MKKEHAKILKQLEAIDKTKVQMAALRDKLRSQVDDLTDILESFNEGLELFEDGKRAFSDGLDYFSQHL